MRKSNAKPDFTIHEDSSCMTDSETGMSTERTASNQTVIQHEVWSEDGSMKDGTEKKEHDRLDDTQAQRERQIDRIEAKIQAAARAVVESIEDDYGRNEESVLSARTDATYGQAGSEVLSGDRTELSYGDDTEATYESNDDSHLQHEENEQEGDSSSHHDGEADDVFSPQSGRSARSSLNSCDDLHDPMATYRTESKSPFNGRKDPHHGDDAVSRISSAASYLRSPPDDTPLTPSKTHSRIPFRTPSSVRAIQMSSPAPSIFSSPRSSKRQTQNMSRMSTPTSHSKNKTPTRFKFKTEKPLILLHVTVLPLRWPYSDFITSNHLPESLQQLQNNWRSLQDKLGDTVLERGILLPHPQDSYEILEERLLEALELPVRPRARILSCGHYRGPIDSSASDDESDTPFSRDSRSRGHCDVCSADFSFETYTHGAFKKGFRIKFFAGNGLMTAGAWAAAWKEMERVDVEIEPLVEPSLVSELEHLVTMYKAAPEMEEEAFVTDDEDPVLHGANHKASEERHMEMGEEEEEELRKQRQEARMREIYGEHTPSATTENASPSSRKPVLRTARPGDTLPELLLAALKVALRDQKNVAICLLSIFVLFLAMRGRHGHVHDEREHGIHVMPRMENVAPTPHVITHLVTETVSVRGSVPTVGVSQMNRIVDPVVSESMAEPPEVTEDTERTDSRPLQQQTTTAPSVNDGRSAKTGDVETQLADGPELVVEPERVIPVAQVETREE